MHGCRFAVWSKIAVEKPCAECNDIKDSYRIRCYLNPFGRKEEHVATVKVLSSLSQWEVFSSMVKRYVVRPQDTAQRGDPSHRRAPY